MMHYIKYSLLLLFLYAAQQAGAQSRENQFRTDDFIYQYDVKTVLLSPAGQVRPGTVPPVVPLGIPLVLEFDKLGDQMERLAVKIISCNADWTVSQLAPTEFLREFNEFYITDRELSFNTKVSYVHYRIELPRVLVSGNYVVKVYQDGYEDELLLSRRFMVYEQQTVISTGLGKQSVVEQAIRNGQLDLTVGYGRLQVVNPAQQLKVVIRQNFRWDNAITNLKPTFVRDFEKLLEFRDFGLGNQLRGGNEFRMFDVRSVQFRNLNVAEMLLKPKMNEIFLFQDKTRDGLAYTRQMEDMDGAFFIENMHGRDHATEADYLEVVFTLYAPQEATGQVYVSGGFSHWLLSEEYKMQYFPEQQRYQTAIVLKQGFYNYQYSLLGKNGQRDDTYFEGDHFMTQNTYEVLVYYRPIGARGDKLVGYKMF